MNDSSNQTPCLDDDVVQNGRRLRVHRTGATVMYRRNEKLPDEFSVTRMDYLRDLPACAECRAAPGAGNAPRTTNH